MMATRSPPPLHLMSLAGTSMRPHQLHRQYSTLKG